MTRLNFTSDTSDLTGWRSRVSSTVYLGLLDMIQGHLVIDHDMHMSLESKGNVMLTGLRGCDEIAHNVWIGKTIPRTPIITTTSAPSGLTSTGMTASFPTSSWQCRNRTLAAALEDLSNNITMSLLGLDVAYVPSQPTHYQIDSTENHHSTQNNTLAHVLFTPSQLVYEYNPFNLILTYCVVGIISLIAAMCGFAALDENGIAHTLRFSAIMDATRSSDLVLVTNDCGLGMMPMDREAETTKLRFGPLKDVTEGDTHRVGFVLADEDISGETKN